MKRSVVAIASVLLVITPISWILLHQPQSDPADASIPFVSRTDDTYATPTSKPVVATPSVKPEASKTPVPTTGTPKPSATPTPGQTPSTDPTDAPTTAPTDGPSTTAPTQAPTTTGPRSSTTPSNTPSSTPTKTTPPPPADNGSMSSSELELFNLVDDARVQQGCVPLRRNSSITSNARDEAEGRADSGQVSATESSKAAAGGDGMSAQSAFNRLKADSSATLFNCGLHQLGVGQATAQYKTGALCSLLGVCTTKTRVAWVADFQ